jgi:hypothetical protein
MDTSLVDFNSVHGPSDQNRWHNTRKFLEICVVSTIAANPILGDHKTSGIGKIISLSFNVYVDHPNQRSDVSYTSI